MLTNVRRPPPGLWLFAPVYLTLPLTPARPEWLFMQNCAVALNYNWQMPAFSVERT